MKGKRKDVNREPAELIELLKEFAGIFKNQNITGIEWDVIIPTLEVMQQEEDFHDQCRIVLENVVKNLGSFKDSQEEGEIIKTLTKIMDYFSDIDKLHTALDTYAVSLTDNERIKDKTKGPTRLMELLREFASIDTLEDQKGDVQQSNEKYFERLDNLIQNGELDEFHEEYLSCVEKNFHPFLNLEDLDNEVPRLDPKDQDRLIRIAAEALAYFANIGKKGKATLALSKFTHHVIVQNDNKVSLMRGTDFSSETEEPLNVTSQDLKLIMYFMHYADCFNTLILQEAGLTKDHVVIIAAFLEHDVSIACLDFNGNHMGDEAAALLDEALAHNQTLSKLVLCGNDIKTFGDCFSTNTKLSELDLSGNGFGELECFSALLSNCSRNIFPRKIKTDPIYMMDVDISDCLETLKRDRITISFSNNQKKVVTLDDVRVNLAHVYTPAQSGRINESGVEANTESPAKGATWVERVSLTPFEQARKYLRDGKDVPSELLAQIDVGDLMQLFEDNEISAGRA